MSANEMMIEGNEGKSMKTNEKQHNSQRQSRKINENRGKPMKTTENH
jgi:hypothetical protein